MSFCSACGAQRTARFCANCGADGGTETAGDSKDYKNANPTTAPAPPPAYGSGLSFKAYPAPQDPREPPVYPPPPPVAPQQYHGQAPASGFYPPPPQIQPIPGYQTSSTVVVERPVAVQTVFVHVQTRRRNRIIGAVVVAIVLIIVLAILFSEHLITTHD